MQPPASAADSFRERLRVLEDREAIRDVLTRYAFTADSRQMDAFLALWTEDAVFEANGKDWHGRDGVLAVMNQPATASLLLPHAVQHLFVNPSICVTGDAASVVVYSLLVTEQDGERAIHSAGFNRFELRRVGPDWQIARRLRRGLGSDNASGLLSAGSRDR